MSLPCRTVKSVIPALGQLDASRSVVFPVELFKGGDRSCAKVLS